MLSSSPTKHRFLVISCVEKFSLRPTDGYLNKLPVFLMSRFYHFLTLVAEVWLSPSGAVFCSLLTWAGLTKKTPSKSVPLY